MQETLLKYWVRYDPEDDNDRNFIQSAAIWMFNTRGMREVVITDQYIKARRSELEVARQLLRDRGLTIRQN